MMRRCIELAKQAEAYTAPNPMVGCLIVKGGEIVSEGYHKAYGTDHAEVMAISNMPSGLSPSDCTLYVNLEPCSHHGKTPPCADLIISKGFKKVVIGALDPNPMVGGTGAERLKQAGLEVEFPVLEAECKYLNRKFYHFHDKRLPYVTLKWAETKDGFIGRHINQSHLSNQISNEECRSFVHQLRAHNMAILIGANTANRDNPKLNLRFYEGNDPIKIILSKNNSVESDLQLFKEGKVLVYNALREDKTDDVEYVKLGHRAFVQHMLEDLYKRGIQSILVEGGSQVLQTFIDHAYWDEAIKIVSENNWETGIRAADIKREANFKESIGDNTIYQYLK